MYKLTRHLPVPSRRLVLVSQRGDGPCSLLVLRPERRYSSQKTYPAKSRKLFWSVTGATLLTGAAVVYAKKNPDFREWLTVNAPWADHVVSVVYQEQDSIGQWASTHVSTIKQNVRGFMFGKENVILDPIPTASEQDLSAKVKWGPQDYDLPKPTLAPHYTPEPEPDSPECPAAVVVHTQPECEPPLPPLPVTKDLVEMEKCMHEYTKTAIDNYNRAADTCIAYNKTVNKIVEATVDQLDNSMFDQLRTTQTERSDAVMVAENAAKHAEQLINDLAKRMEGGGAPPDAVQATKRLIEQFRKDLKAARDEFLCQNEKCCIADRYWQRVETARNAYMKELKAIYPSLDFEARRLSIAGGDPDMLLLHTLRQVLHLQREVCEMQTVRDLRLRRALESRDDKDVIAAKAEEMYSKEKYNLYKEFQDKTFKLTADAENKRREDLKKQMELHEEILKDKLAAKEKEVLERFEKFVSEKVEKETVDYHEKLALVSGKLKAIEDSVKARAKADAAMRRSQSLWAAGESLLAATRKSTGVADVVQEIKALEKAGADDELVTSVVKGISKDIRERGVFTENALREKYNKMEKTALKVALVSKDGAPLPVYFLSWLQSFLLFSKITDIPQSELDNQPTDYSRMDAFDILQRARYWMERNDIAAALRYVNLLEGASRAASDSWREAAIRHLETRQAAEAVMAHAAAAGLLQM